MSPSEWNQVVLLEDRATIRLQRSCRKLNMEALLFSFSFLWQAEGSWIPSVAHWNLARCRLHVARLSAYNRQALSSSQSWELKRKRHQRTNAFAWYGTCRYKLHNFRAQRGGSCISTWNMRVVRLVPGIPNDWRQREQVCISFRMDMGDTKFPNSTCFRAQHSQETRANDTYITNPFCILPAYWGSSFIVFHGSQGYRQRERYIYIYTERAM